MGFMRIDCCNDYYPVVHAIRFVLQLLLRKSVSFNSETVIDKCVLKDKKSKQSIALQSITIKMWGFGLLADGMHIVF